MTPLISLLLFAALLGLIQVVATGSAISSQRGFAYSASARDAQQPPLQGAPSRVIKASHNFLETFGFFVVVALVAHMLNRETSMAVWGAWIYVVARVIYWPLYVAGVPVIRSLVWVASIVGIMLVGIAASFG